MTLVNKTNWEEKIKRHYYDDANILLLPPFPEVRSWSLSLFPVFLQWNFPLSHLCLCVYASVYQVPTQPPIDAHTDSLLESRYYPYLPVYSLYVSKSLFPSWFLSFELTINSHLQCKGLLFSCIFVGFSVIHMKFILNMVCGRHLTNNPNILLTIPFHMWSHLLTKFLQDTCWGHVPLDLSEQ